MNINNVRSEAWNIVTVYYLGFFSAQALLRLIGSPIFFIGSELANSLTTNTGFNFHKGAYSLVKLSDSSATISEYQLKISKQRPHDLVWNTLFNLLQKKLDTASTSQSSNPETVYYSNLLTKPLYKVYNTNAWPSEVRNRCNYRPGFAYKLISNQFIGVTKHLLDRWNNLTENKLLNLLQQSIGGYTASKDSTRFEIQVMHDVCMALFITMRTLYTDIMLRQSTDKRWENRRRSFINQNQIFSNDFSYLYK